MSDSILTSVKKILSIAADSTEFDVDVIMHINTAFSTLNQMGIGPDEGFEIEDAVLTWDDFLANDPRLNSVKTYISLRVRLLFDPPTTSYLIASMKEQVQELEWRLNVQREVVTYPEEILELLDEPVNSDDESDIVDLFDLYQDAKE